MSKDPPRLKDDPAIGDVLASARADEPRDEDLAALGKKLAPVFALSVAPAAATALQAKVASAAVAKGGVIGTLAFKIAATSVAVAVASAAVYATVRTPPAPTVAAPP